MEDLVQPTAGIPNQGGGHPHHLVHRHVTKDFDAVEGDRAGGEEVVVGEQNAAAPAGAGDAVPAGQRCAALRQAGGQGIPGHSVAQGRGEGGRGAQQGGEAPEQVLRPAPPHRGQYRKEQTGQQQQRGHDVKNPLRPVGGLHLAAKADGFPGPLGIAVLAIPHGFIQCDQIGLTGGGRCAAGHPLALSLKVVALHGEGQRQSGNGAVGLPLRGAGKAHQG